MHFSDDDLRSALRRKDPGEAFTQRVMVRVHQRRAESAPRERPSWRLSLNPRFAGVVAAALLVAVGFLGLMRYRHIHELERGELAKQQAILALRITTTKLNQVFAHVRSSQDAEEKIRREHL